MCVPRGGPQAEGSSLTLDIPQAVWRGSSGLTSIRKGDPPPHKVDSRVSHQGGVSQGAEDAHRKEMPLLVRSSFPQEGPPSSTPHGVNRMLLPGSQTGNTLPGGALQRHKTSRMDRLMIDRQITLNR